MVRGIDKFREFFTGYEGNYVIIGGTACEMHEEIYAQTPRATKDIDIILIVEALSSDFAAKFWEFVKTAGYRQRNKGTGNGECRHEYYRFKEPGNPDFPYQIELFSRNIGVVKFPDDAHITPIPVDDDLSSLSAILMDDDYYNYTIEHSTLEEGVHIANIESLICLKCRAYLEMTERKNNGNKWTANISSSTRKMYSGWLPCLLLPTPTKFLIRLNKMLTGFAWLSKKKCQTLIFSNRQDLKAFPENSYWNNLKPIS